MTLFSYINSNQRLGSTFYRIGSVIMETDWIVWKKKQIENYGSAFLAGWADLNLCSRNLGMLYFETSYMNPNRNVNKLLGMPCRTGNHLSLIFLCSTLHELFFLPSFIQLGFFSLYFFNLKLPIMHFFCFCNTI